MSNTIIIASMGWIGGIITTCIGVFLHSLVADRKLKKRLCVALYEELKLNLAYLRQSVTFQGKEYCIPYALLLSSYTDARNYGLIRELPKEIGTEIENCYTFLQNLNTYRFGAAIREDPTILSEPKSEVVDEVTKSIDQVLPKLEEFSSNLRVYPHDDVAYIVRKIRRAG